MGSTGVMGFNESGVAKWSIESIAEFLPFLNDQLEKLQNADNRSRPWHYWELHNPWSRSSVMIDSWRFLDLCQSPALLEQVQQMLGPDVILFDSRIVSHPGRKSEHPEWTLDKIYFPVSPAKGITVRIPIMPRSSDKATFTYGSKSKPLKTQEISISNNHIIAHDMNSQYQIIHRDRSSGFYEYLIRYFPATSRYIRDPSAREHKILTELYPLMNYATLPLWLVCGEDRADNDFVTGFSTKIGRWV